MSGSRRRHEPELQPSISGTAGRRQLAGAQHEENLRGGLSSQDVIGQARGILMERHELTAQQALGLLARVSQELNRKLVDIARELADTGAVPGADRRRD